MAAKIKALTQMIRHSFQLKVEAGRMFEWKREWGSWMEWTGLKIKHAKSGAFVVDYRKGDK